MSLLTRPSRRKKTTTSKDLATPPAKMAREAEAPDRGGEAAHREAPERGRVRVAEAPDAGEGRAAALDHEFTHGRSQS